MTITAQVLTGTVTNSPLDWVVGGCVCFCLITICVTFAVMVFRDLR